MIPEIPAQRDFVADLADIDKRMAKWREYLQPHFDRMALPIEKQAEHYENLRLGIPDEMAKESRGEAWWQTFNARQKRLEKQYDLTAQEFNEILLPSLCHISYIPDLSKFGTRSLFLCASTDWKEQRTGKEGLIGKCDDLYVSTFVHVAADNYRVLMKCEQEGVNRVMAMYGRPVCVHCQKDKSEIIEAAPILAAIRAGLYPFAHVISNEVEDVYLCPGPKLMIFENSIDPAKFDKFMARVKESQAKYQAEAVDKLKGNL